MNIKQTGFVDDLDMEERKRGFKDKGFCLSTEKDRVSSDWKEQIRGSIRTDFWILNILSLRWLLDIWVEN